MKSVLTFAAALVSLWLGLGITPVLLFAEDSSAHTQTSRIPQLENEDVQVWKTIIYPKQPLKMHRHDNRRIIVALTDTELLVKNDQGATHKLKWKKGNAYVLEADKPNEMHADINESDHPMEVMVIQFKNKTK